MGYTYLTISDVFSVLFMSENSLRATRFLNIEDGQMYRLLIPDILNEKAFKLFDPVHNILTGNFTNFEPSK